MLIAFSSRGHRMGMHAHHMRITQVIVLCLFWSTYTAVGDVTALQYFWSFVINAAGTLFIGMSCRALFIWAERTNSISDPGAYERGRTRPVALQTAPAGHATH